MAKLYFKNAQHFENPTRMIFAGGGELFGGSGEKAKNIKAWLENKESSEDAKKLAEEISKQREEILSGSKQDLLELYVNLFTTSIASKEVFNVEPFTVGETYIKNGLLEVLEKNSSDLRLAFSNVADLRLLSYSTVYNNFKDQELDANYLPMGAQVTLVNGVVTVTYTENGLTKTASSEIFPWSTYEQAHAKYAELYAPEAPTDDGAATRGLPTPVTETTPTPGYGDNFPVPTAEVTEVAPGTTETSKEASAGAAPSAPDTAPSSEPEETEGTEAETPSLDKEWEGIEATLLTLKGTYPDTEITITEPSPRNGRLDLPKHSKLIEVKNTKTGDSYIVRVYVPRKDRPTSYDDERVTVRIQEQIPGEGKKERYLTKNIDNDPERERIFFEGSNRIFDTANALAKILAKEANPNPELDKDWVEVLKRTQALVKADVRTSRRVTIQEAPRNERGADKTLIITNTQTGQSVRYMVGVNEKNNPKSYGPAEGAPADAARSYDASSIHLTAWIVGQGNQTDDLSKKLDAYFNGNTMVPSVERGAYDLALIVSGFPPETQKFPGELPLNRSFLKDTFASPKKLAEAQAAVENMRPANYDGWVATEKAYQALLAMGRPEAISSKAHVLGAGAAFVMGNIALTQARYRLAVAKNDDSTSVASSNAQLRAIYTAYANTYLEGGTLTAKSLESSSDYHANAIKLANDELKKHGSFSGLLPKGEYVLDNTEFTVK